MRIDFIAEHPEMPGVQTPVLAALQAQLGNRGLR
jgi:hypothetical protein